MEVFAFITLKNYLEKFTQEIPKNFYRYRLTKNELVSFIEKDGFFKSKDNILIFLENQLSNIKNYLIIFSYIVKYNIYREEFIIEKIFKFEQLNFFIEWGEIILDKELEKFIMSVKPKAFEHFICDLFNSLSKYRGINVGKVTRDGGLDFSGYEILNKNNEIRIYGQVKRWRKKVTAPIIVNFIGSIKIKSNNQKCKGIFVSTGGFTEDAKKLIEKQSPIKIEMIDIEKLKAIIMEHKIGVKQYKKELFVIDEKYWDEINLFKY